MQIYVIEKAWSSPDENYARDAFGYAPVGYVESETEAQAIVAAGGCVPPGFTWIKEEANAPMYRFKTLPRMGE